MRTAFKVMPIHRAAFRLRRGATIACLAAFLLPAGTAFAFQPATTGPDAPPPATEEKEEKLLTLKDMPVPTAEELLQNPPVDWIVLKNSEEVIVCEPVAPRPKTLEKMQAKIDDSRNWPRPVGKEEIQEHFRKRDALNYLKIALPGEEDGPEYQLHMKFIQEIVHHEDLILRRVDLFLNDGRFRAAFELLYLLERDTPHWPGWSDRHNRLLFLEAEAARKEGRLENSLVRQEELHALDSKFAGLRASIGSTVDELAAQATRDNDFPRARHYLERLRFLEPQHAVYSRWKSELEDRARGLMKEANDASASGRPDVAAALMHRAARVWPATPVLPESFRRATARFQTLDVGVVRLADEATAYPFPASAELRQRRLLEAELFELDAFDEVARYRSPLLEEWTPVDLGRRARFQLRPTRTPSESAPIVTAGALERVLGARLDHQSPWYDERLASAVQSVQVLAPFEIEMQFARAPLRLEALLTGPLRRTMDRAAQPIDTRSLVIAETPMREIASDATEFAVAELPGESSEERPTARAIADRRQEPIPSDVLAPRFGVHSRSPDTVVYRRTKPEPEGLTRHHLAEIVERKYPSTDKAIQALVRGDVSLLPSVPAWDVEPLRQDGRFFVQKAALPVTHLIQFHPRSKALRHRELRRALSYAIDRPMILRAAILKNASPDLARLVAGALPTKSIAYNRTTPLVEYDPAIATAFALAARKQVGGALPELTLVCDPDPVSQDAAKQCLEHWAARGIRVRLRTEPFAEGETPAWDLCYRTLQMAEPATDLWPLLTAEPRAKVESLQHLPQWLSRELISLDQTVDTASAIQRLKQLQAHLAAETELIPLWEVDAYVVFRKNVRQFVPEPVHPYQQSESWIVEPWYVADPL